MRERDLGLSEFRGCSQAHTESLHCRGAELPNWGGCGGGGAMIPLWQDAKVAARMATSS